METHSQTHAHHSHQDTKHPSYGLRFFLAFLLCLLIAAYLLTASTSKENQKTASNPFPSVQNQESRNQDPGSNISKTANAQELQLELNMYTGEIGATKIMIGDVDVYDKLSKQDKEIQTLKKELEALKKSR